MSKLLLSFFLLSLPLTHAVQSSQRSALPRSPGLFLVDSFNQKANIDVIKEKVISNLEIFYRSFSRGTEFPPYGKSPCYGDGYGYGCGYLEPNTIDPDKLSTAAIAEQLQEVSDKVWMEEFEKENMCSQLSSVAHFNCLYNRCEKEEDKKKLEEKFDLWSSLPDKYYSVTDGCCSFSVCPVSTRSPELELEIQMKVLDKVLSHMKKSDLDKVRESYRNWFDKNSLLFPRRYSHDVELAVRRLISK